MKRLRQTYEDKNRKPAVRSVMEQAQKRDIRFCTLDEINEFFFSHGDKPFRGKQVWEWLWRKAARNFAEMTSISVATRKFLNENFLFPSLSPAATVMGEDRTIKLAFQLPDKKIIEGVLIPTDERMTACISTQVGCSLSCKFCATGRLGFTRNLEFYEMFDEVSIIAKYSMNRFDRPLTNIVFMGMGEPLLNYDNLMKVVNKITAPEGLNMSSARITVSTVGLARMIKKLGNDDAKFNLALSLHAANDRKRSEIIPVNKHNSLAKLADALKHYHAKTRNRVTFEYLLLGRFNDSLADAKELAEFCKNIPCKVNLIEYNFVEGTGFQKADEISTKAFAGFLETRNIIVSIRKSRGENIGAACGQLAYRTSKRPVIRY